jgi:beta-1,2-mannobiose phosphorylase / 1,2-beta-oligomannan phosphorylase
MENFFESLIKKYKKEADAIINGVNVKKLGPILEPTARSFERTAVLNPAVYQKGQFVHIFYRAVSEDGKSSIGYAKLKGPTKVVKRNKKPIITSYYDYEKKGVEDPRIVKIDGTFYLTYVAHDGKNSLTALATSKDLKSFKKQGLISPLMTYDKAGELFREQRLKDRYSMFQAYYEEMAGEDVKIWFKDAILFPQKIHGNYAMLVRVLPDIQLICFKNFNQLKKKSFWDNYIKSISHFVLLENKYWFESRNIGGGCVPIYTKMGWLIIFHSVEELNKARVYHASCALLDKNNPLNVIGRLDMPLFSPTESWEKQGFVSNVVFPSGAALFKNDLYIYYGAADTRIAAAKIKLDALLKKLKKSI